MATLGPRFTNRHQRVKKSRASATMSAATMTGRAQNRRRLLVSTTSTNEPSSSAQGSSSRSASGSSSNWSLGSGGTQCQSVASMHGYYGGSQFIGSTTSSNAYGTSSPGPGGYGYMEPVEDTAWVI